jgi:hypothetical protein
MNERQLLDDTSMGQDFAHHHVFSHSTHLQTVHATLLQRLLYTLRTQGYEPTEQSEDADRILVVGPPGRWIWIYDSAASGDNPANQAVADLAQAVSTVGTVVDTFVYDSSLLHFFLYRHGKRADQFVTAPDFYLTMLRQREPETTYQAHDFAGQPAVWQELLLPAYTSTMLRTIWQQSAALMILEQTANLVGWNEIVCHGGYTIQDDGFVFGYNEYFREEEYNISHVHIYQFVKVVR